MKKHLQCGLTAALTLALLLTACGQKEADANDTPPSAQAGGLYEDFFTGDVTDWTAVGGNPGKFSIYTRNTSSGTYSDWKELAMKKCDYASSSQKMAGNEQIAAEVAKNPNGIGYVGLAYTHAPGIRVVGILGKDKVAVRPSNQTVQAKTYPYARPTFFYTNGEPSGLTAEFVDFMLGTEGQALVQKVGFVPAVQH